MNSACRARRHTWASNPPTVGTPCAKPDCGAAYRGGFPAAKVTEKTTVSSTPGAPSSDEEGQPYVELTTTAPAGSLADRIARSLATRAARTVQAAPVAPVAPLPPPPPSSFHHHLARRLTKLFDGGTDAIVEKLKRKPNDPDPDDLADFEQATAEQLARWLPDTEVPPWGRMALAGGFIVSAKYVGAEKVTGPTLRLVPQDERPTDARHVDTTSGPQAPLSTSPQGSQPPDPDAEIPPGGL